MRIRNNIKYRISSINHSSIIEVDDGIPRNAQLVRVKCNFQKLSKPAYLQNIKI